MAISQNTSVIMMCIASCVVGFFAHNLVSNRTLDLTASVPVSPKHVPVLQSQDKPQVRQATEQPVLLPQADVISNAQDLKAQHNIERVYDAQLGVVCYKVMRDVPVSVSCVAARDLYMQSIK